MRRAPGSQHPGASGGSSGRDGQVQAGCGRGSGPGHPFAGGCPSGPIATSGAGGTWLAMAPMPPCWPLPTPAPRLRRRQACARLLARPPASISPSPPPLRGRAASLQQGLRAWPADHGPPPAELRSALVPRTHPCLRATPPTSPGPPLPVLGFPAYSESGVFHVGTVGQQLQIPVLIHASVSQRQHGELKPGTR